MKLCRPDPRDLYRERPERSYRTSKRSDRGEDRPRRTRAAPLARRRPGWESRSDQRAQPTEYRIGIESDRYRSAGSERGQDTRT
eukprot:15471528-Alexandrium_andersonii.AAC.1